MARVNAQQWAEKWGRKLGAASEDIKAGVNAVKVAPGVSAAERKDDYVAGVNASAEVWANNVAKVSLGDWQQSMISKTIPRLQQGIEQAKTRKLSKIAAMLAANDAAVQAIASIPRGGLEQNIARATQFMREMAARAPKRQR